MHTRDIRKTNHPVQNGRINDSQVQPNGLGPQPRSPVVFDSSNKSGLSVCLLDDDSSVLKSTSRLLSSAGWKVEAFTDPVEFLRYAQTNHPKVVVLDIRMPIMNGLEVQTQLREISPETRVVVLTSKDDPSVRSQAMDGGASAFFLKPVCDERFLAEIESAVGSEK
jgi:FixJ family two-component response regulator